MSKSRISYSLANKEDRVIEISDETEYFKDMNDRIAELEQQIDEAIKVNYKERLKLEYQKNKNWLKYKEKQKAYQLKTKELKSELKSIEGNHENNKLHHQLNLNNFEYIENRRKDYVTQNQLVNLKDSP